MAGVSALPERPAPALRKREKRTARTPRHVLHPDRINRTWHVDLTVLPLFGMGFPVRSDPLKQRTFGHVAAIVDGFSRKLLALRVYARTPTAVMMSALVKRTARTIGAMPRFIVTAWGQQFRTTFQTIMHGALAVIPVRGKVRTCTLNGKAERFFRTFKEWARRVLFAWFVARKRTARRIQRRLGAFASWHDQWPRQAIAGRTPEEARARKRRRRARPVPAHRPQSAIEATRRDRCGDRLLPVIDIRVTSPRAAQGGPHTRCLILLAPCPGRATVPAPEARCSRATVGPPCSRSAVHRPLGLYTVH